MSDKSILKEAHEIIYGDREKTYGHPAKNLDTIAKMWNLYLVANGVAEKDGGILVAQDVACMMILLKVARLANDPTHRDSIVDIAGYSALIERCDESESKQA
jgi:hypothetical protein